MPKEQDPSLLQKVAHLISKNPDIVAGTLGATIAVGASRLAAANDDLPTKAVTAVVAGAEIMLTISALVDRMTTPNQ